MADLSGWLAKIIARDTITQGSSVSEYVEARAAFKSAFRVIDGISVLPRYTLMPTFSKPAPSYMCKSYEGEWLRREDVMHLIESNT